MCVFLSSRAVFIDLLLYLCAHTALRKPGHRPILIHAPSWKGDLLGCDTETPSRERRVHRDPSHLPCCLLLSSVLSSNIPTDELEHQVPSEAPMNKILMCI